MVHFSISVNYLSDRAGEGYGFTQDTDGVHFFAPEGERAIVGIFGFKDDMIIIEPEAFEGGFAVNEDGSDLAGVHGFLLPDINGIAIEDPSVDHAVTLAGEGEVCPNVFRGVHITLNVFLCEDRCAAGNGSDQWDFIHGGKWDDVLRICWCIVHGEEVVRLNI